MQEMLLFPDLIIYIFDSLTSVCLYIVLLTTYISVMQNNEKIGLLFIPFFAALMPHYYFSRKEDNPIRSTVYNYLLLIASIIGLGISLEKNVPGLWIIAYSNLFIVYYLAGENTEDGRESLFYSPFKVAGIIGTGIFLYLLTFGGFWNDIGWRHYRSDYRFHEWASIYDYIICITLPILSGFLFYRVMRNKLKLNLVVAITGIYIILLYILDATLINENITAWLVNLFILFFSIYSIIYGYKNKSLLQINLSAIYLAVTIISRFFDQDISFLIRGIVFILTGILILSGNLIFLKSFKKEKCNK
ncbi:MAG: hypothetical protein M1308_17520 [Actinobacteria bacterium]|nr:hypothetical protein [Actinomycetota bacterium]